MQADYFEVLGLERGLDVNLVDLNTRYFKLQQEFHPDKNKDGAEKSAMLNLAYSALKNRFRRLEYLVELSGKIAKENPALLMEVMELREEYEESPEAVSLKIEAEIENLYANAGLDFKAGKLDDMADKAIKIKYLQNVIANT